MGTAKGGHKKGLSAGFRKLRKAEDESLEICTSGLDGSVLFRSVPCVSGSQVRKLRAVHCCRTRGGKSLQPILRQGKLRPGKGFGQRNDLAEKQKHQKKAQKG